MRVLGRMKRVARTEVLPIIMKISGLQIHNRSKRKTQANDIHLRGRRECRSAFLRFAISTPKTDAQKPTIVVQLLVVEYRHSQILYSWSLGQRVFSDSWPGFGC